MKASRWMFVLVLLVAAVAVFAQEGPAVPAVGSQFKISSFPGQAWSALGNLSPAEKGNVQSATYVEQGVTVFSNRTGSITLTPYVSLGFVKDTNGYDWNNKVVGTAGVKLNKFFRHGVVSVGTGYSYEDHFKSGLSRGGAVAYVQDWFGWHPVMSKTSRFPGSTWAVLGNISPMEHNNLIALGYVQQGVVAHRFGRMAIVPYGEATFGYDSQRLDWERKAIFGSGVKAAFPLGNHYAEVGAGYTHENRFMSGNSAGGFKVFMNVSFAWKLFGKGRK